MSAISFKSFVVTAAIGLATVFTAGAAANAASPLSAPAVSQSAQSSVLNVDYRGHGRDRRQHVRPPHRGPACSAQTARAKASRMGIRNARVIQRGKSVQVRGFRHGRPAGVVFANVRGCPIIR